MTPARPRPTPPRARASRAAALLPALWCGAVLAPGAAHAEDPFFDASFDVGGGGRFVELPGTVPGTLGLSTGLRLDAEVANFQFRTDIRYFEAEAFRPGAGRYVDVSAAVSSPAALIFCFDVHEVYARSVGRPFDGLFYAAGGLGLKGRIVHNTIKATLGGLYLHGPSPLDDRAGAGGPFLGANYMLHLPLVVLDARAGAVVAFHQGQPHPGVLVDVDLVLKFPVGKVRLGPRFDVSARWFGDADGVQLLGMGTDIGAHVGFAISWGTSG